MIIVMFSAVASGAAAAKKVQFGSTKELLNQIPERNKETVILAGGCFWGMEDLIRKIPGVLSTEVGYSGGSVKNPTYSDVKTGNSGHAEAVKVDFDKTKVSYEILLDYYFRMHDPTTLNKQGNDRGTQYRSAIFYTSDNQKKIAEEVIKKTNKSGFWKEPVVTQVIAFKEFTKAEDYHQDYLVKNPGGYTCHWLRK
jgi:peptide methionine sulfoxide reductase msrA/msrB